LYIAVFGKSGLCGYYQARNIILESMKISVKNKAHYELQAPSPVNDVLAIWGIGVECGEWRMHDGVISGAPRDISLMTRGFIESSPSSGAM
jgi:hypothetical protein